MNARHARGGDRTKTPVGAVKSDDILDAQRSHLLAAEPQPRSQSWQRNVANDISRRLLSGRPPTSKQSEYAAPILD